MNEAVDTNQLMQAQLCTLCESSYALLSYFAFQNTPIIALPPTGIF